MNKEELLEKAKKILRECKLHCKKLAFNVFEATGVSYYEIPMTNFLYELLRTDGVCGKNTLYLKQFFRDVLEFQDSDDDLLKELEEAYVYREHRTDEGRSIDLVIDTPNRFIPMEVKITASEGYNQCLDYFTYSKKRNESKQNKKDWKLFFLTLDSHFPESTKDLNEQDLKLIQPICWGGQIINWLNNILKFERCEEEYVLYAAIEQYMNVLENFTAESKEMSKMTEEIKWNEEDIKALNSLQESFQRAKASFLEKFFYEIKKGLSENKEFYEDSMIIELDKDNNGNYKFDKFYTSNRSNYPGISCKVKTNEDKNYVLSIRLEIGDSPYIGFQVNADRDDKDTLDNAKNWAIDNCINIDHHKDLIKDNPYGWIYYTDIKPQDWSQNTLSFRNKDNSAYLFLRDKNKQEEFIREIVKKFKDLKGWLK